MGKRNEVKMPSHPLTVGVVLSLLGVVHSSHIWRDICVQHAWCTQTSDAWDGYFSFHGEAYPSPSLEKVLQVPIVEIARSPYSLQHNLRGQALTVQAALTRSQELIIGVNLIKTTRRIRVHTVTSCFDTACLHVRTYTVCVAFTKILSTCNTQQQR